MQWKVASAPVLYMALELSNKTWRLAFSDGAKRRHVYVPASDLAKLACAVAKAKERFGMPASSRVLSCYEAGRDGFWLHRHLVSVGIENEVVHAASIEVSRRLRHVKTIGSTEIGYSRSSFGITRASAAAGAWFGYPAWRRRTRGTCIESWSA